MKKAATSSSSIHRCIVGCIFLSCFIIILQANHIRKLRHEYNIKTIQMLEDVVSQTNKTIFGISAVSPTPKKATISFAIDEQLPQTKILHNKKAISSLDSERDMELLKWHTSIRLVMTCIFKKQGGLFFYHTRKAAGTTIRDWLTEVSFQYQLPLFESEGVSLNHGLLELKNVLSVTAIRHPIDRILSLYWYEHVAWWIDIKHENEKAKPLHEWVAGWSDGSSFKQKMVTQNPGTVYVEIENYYVKSLIGWKGGNSPLTENDLEKAKQTLREFHLVFISESMSSSNTTAFLNKIFQPDTWLASEGGGGSHAGAIQMSSLLRASNKGQSNNKKAFPILVEKQDEVVARLTVMNALDIKLWDYALSLFRARKEYVNSLEFVANSRGNDQCSGKVKDKLPPNLQASIGIFRPVGHKGPF